MSVAAAALLAVVVGLVVVASSPTERSASLVSVPVAAPLPPTTDGQVAASWLSSTSAATSIPRRALLAYADAAVRTSEDDPTCRIAWNTLAGIGAAESSHGRFAGARLTSAGVASPAIIGIPLDGNGVLAVRDTDDGRLDGDARWDRAVGPLQFIPSTWARWGADADGDGHTNPQDIDDAALTAARYLCHAGGDLSASEGWSRAVLTYNRSVSYASKVARTATDYARTV